MTALYQIVLGFVRNLRQMWADFMCMIEYSEWGD